jgi:hypothetical protein
LADPDVWFRGAVKSVGMQYYEYLLVYMDDMLMISHEPQITMDTLGRQYHMKEGRVGNLPNTLEQML